jgi:hypothetical protein
VVRSLYPHPHHEVPAKVRSSGACAPFVIADKRPSDKSEHWRRGFWTPAWSAVSGQSSATRRRPGSPAATVVPAWFFQIASDLRRCILASIAPCVSHRSGRVAGSGQLADVCAAPARTRRHRHHLALLRPPGAPRPRRRRPGHRGSHRPRGRASLISLCWPATHQAACSVRYAPCPRRKLPAPRRAPAGGARVPHATRYDQASYACGRPGAARRAPGTGDRPPRLVG